MSRRRNKPPSRAVGRPRVPASPGAEYSQWLLLIPKEKRKEVAEFIRSNPIRDYDDLITFNIQIMAALVEGRITPVIATELRHWHELNFSVISAKNTVQGTPEETYTDVITALVQVQRETKRLHGDYFDADAMNMPECIEVKSG